MTLELVNDIAELLLKADFPLKCKFFWIQCFLLSIIMIFTVHNNLRLVSVFQPQSWFVQLRAFKTENQNACIENREREKLCSRKSKDRL